MAAGVAGGATRAALTQHFALRGNAADVSAKEGSQARHCVADLGCWTACRSSQGSPGRLQGLLCWAGVPCRTRAGSERPDACAWLQETATTLVGMLMGMAMLHFCSGAWCACDARLLIRERW